MITLPHRRKAFAASGGVSFAATYSHFESTSTIYLEGPVVDGPLKWDRTGSNIDPDGMMETVNYSEFTIPSDGILFLHCTIAYNKSGGSGLNQRFYLMDGDGVVVPPIDSTYVGFRTNTYQGASSGAHNVYVVSANDVYEIWFLAGGGWGQNMVGPTTRMDMILWKAV